MIHKPGSLKISTSWQRRVPQPGLSPKFSLKKGKINKFPFALLIQSQGIHCVGEYVNHLQIKSGKYYKFHCSFFTKVIPDPLGQVTVRLDWKRDGQVILVDWLCPVNYDRNWFLVEEVLQSPNDSDCLEIRLGLQWTTRGEVGFSDIEITEVDAPPPRVITIATSCFIPPQPTTPEANRKFFAEKVEEAGKRGVDILLLSEWVNMLHTGLEADIAKVGEPVPGPTTDALGAVARRYKMYVVCSLIEQSGRYFRNSGVLIGRNGEIVGKHWKSQMPSSERDMGITPGQHYNVFKTDFGIIGIQICWEHYFPEVTRTLTRLGAEIIFTPIMSDERRVEEPTGTYDLWEAICRSRAVDNGVYYVGAVYYNKRSLIVHPTGRLLADTAGEGLALATIDLNEPIIWPLAPPERRHPRRPGFLESPF